METDHIVPTEEGGADDIKNAIPVCFECHAEIHGYNDMHPRGRKFTSDELRAHKAQWLNIIRENPAALLNAGRDTDVGPLQALIDELEFNKAVAESESAGENEGLFQSDQFRRAIERGSISILKEPVMWSVIDAYRLMGSANVAIAAIWRSDSDKVIGQAKLDARARRKGARIKIDAAISNLLRFLGSEVSD